MLIGCETFADLEDFAREWALPTERERLDRRLRADMTEVKALYDGVMPRLEGIVRHLNQYPLGQIPVEDRPLEYLAYAAVEASLAVERFGQPEVPDSFDARRFIAVHE